MTRTTARIRGAPPRRAPRSPSRISIATATATQTGIRAGFPGTIAAISGGIAPAENAAADAAAACRGRARRSSYPGPELVARVRSQRS